MNYPKYQEALDRLLNDDYDFSHDFYEDDKATAMEHDIDTLQELVDKATPKRPILNKIWEDEDTKNIYDECGRINELLCVCPNCGESAIYDFEYNKRFKCCSHCGQRIDWSDNAGDYFKDEYELVKQYIEQLEQALDKACEELETFDDRLVEYNIGDSNEVMTKEEWKEWCIEDDE